jgi:bacterioferritin
MQVTIIPARVPFDRLSVITGLVQSPNRLPLAENLVRRSVDGHCCGDPFFLRYSFGAMNGNPKVIAELNKALQEELTAINQYFLHAEMCENWGYHKLSEFIKKQSIGEMKHAEVLIERILFLDGSPSMVPLELKVGGTVKGMIESDLSLEISAVKQYNDAVAIATKEGDNGSRDLLVQLLKDEEEHVDFLEAQLHQIKELGYERYLTQQMGEQE